MKTRINFLTFLTAIIAAMTLVSCDDFLEVAPKSTLSDAATWSSVENANMFLNSLYGYLPDPTRGYDIEDFYTDIAMNSLSYAFSRTYNASAYTSDNGPSKWGNYNNIRACNVFITNVSASSLDEAWKKTSLAEARFLRAYFYTLLYTYHGGVPVITDVLNLSVQGDAIFRPRNTAAETAKFIVDECAEIANDLPLRPAQAGRITKGAALTLKAWCELFSASPLHNAGNDKAKWTEAATTYRQVMDLNVYDLFANHRTLFLQANNNNVETIFKKGKMANNGTFGGSREGYTGVWIVNGAQRAWGSSNPTQELVDNYFMANGLPITDPASGYDPQNPYEDREQRFYNDIIYDGAEWCGYPIPMYVGFVRGGLDVGDADEASNTAYAQKKLMDEQFTVSGANNLSGADYIIFRFAEVLLGYAEAQNEAAGPDASVYEAINRVRARVDLPELKEGMTQEQMREAIRQERVVELSFEDKRLLDLFRWKTAEIELNKARHAMRIELSGDTKTYSVVPAAGGNCTFSASKNYFWPIPQSAIDRNKNLVQNPGY